MSVDKREMSGDQYVEMACGAENLSPYSNSVGYSEPSSYYQNEFEWQQAQQLQHQSLPTETHSRESDRLYYPGFTDGIDASNHGYIVYGHQPVGQINCYSQTHSMWPIDNPGDHLSHGHRFFSGIDLSQQSLVSPASSTTGSTSKPKRKRVQSYSQRKAANVRERRRMFHLNEAFDELRKRLPAFNYEKRLSRIETLRLAMTYISFMKEVSGGRDPKCVKLKPHGADLPPLPRGSSNLYISQSYSSDSNKLENNNAQDDSDSSNNEMSNDSEVH